jgi:hypothetical protein
MNIQYYLPLIRLRLLIPCVHHVMSFHFVPFPFMIRNAGELRIHSSPALLKMMFLQERKLQNAGDN